MIKVYHFANMGYGRPFLENYASLADELDLTIVFSLNRKKSKGLRSLLSYYYFRYQAYQSYKKEFANYPFKILVIENVNDPRFLKKIQKGSLGLCTGFNQIFSGELIARFKYFVNVHPSLLPFYRGPVPAYWCLKNKEKQTGYTLHHLTSKIDQGEIIYQEIVPIADVDTESTLDQKIAMAAKVQLKKWLNSQLQKKIFSTQQIDAAKIYQCQVDYQSFPRP